MKIQPRAFFLFVFAALCMAFVPTIFAQDETFGLSEADFALLNEANTGLGTVSSFRFDYTVSTALSGVPNANATLDFEGSGAAMTGENPALMLTLDGQTTLGSGPSAPLSAEIRIVDGMVYVNMVDPNTGQPSGWFGQPLDDLSGAAGIPTTTGAVDAGAAFTALHPETFIAMRRETDVIVGGQNNAHFVIEIDVPTLFSSPFMEGIIAGFMQVGAPNAGPVPTPSQLAALLADSTFNVEQWVGLDDQRVHRTLVDLALNISPKAIGASGDDAVVNFNFDITLDHFDEAVSITAPENAVVQSPQTSGAQTAPAVLLEGTIAANTPTTIQMTSQGPVELTYTTSGAETITITARSVVANTVDTTLEVISPDGRTLAFNDDRPLAMTDTGLGSFDSAVQDLNLPEAGTYIIRVGSYNNTGIGQVEVLVTSDAPATSAVNPPTTTTSEIVPAALTPDGVFAYSFAASEGETVTIAARDVSGTLDTSLVLMDSQFNGLVENDDHTSDDPMLDPLDAKIQDFVIPADGVYHVMASDVTGAGGLFQLVIIRGGGRVSDYAEIEPIAPPLVDDPNAIRLGDIYTFTLDGVTPGTRTFYASAGQEITITATAVDPASPGVDVYLTVFDANGAPIAFNDDHGSSDSTLGQRDARIATLTLPTAGAYRIEVDSWFDLSGEVAVQVGPG